MHVLSTARAEDVEEGVDVQLLLQRTQDAFENAMDDDLNISGALGAIFEMVREVNRTMANQQLSAHGARQVRALMHRFDTVLGLLTPDEEAIDSQVEILASERQEARQRRDFTRADALRDRIRELGFVVEDTPQGPRLKRL
jgi:cysteinyl-tRNA synthetase